jgi:hypothetical protein
LLASSPAWAIYKCESATPGGTVVYGDTPCRKGSRQSEPDLPAVTVDPRQQALARERALRSREKLEQLQDERTKAERVDRSRQEQVRLRNEELARRRQQQCEELATASRELAEDVLFVPPRQSARAQLAASRAAERYRKACPD